MEVNQNVPAEIRYTVANVVTTTPFHIARGYVNSADAGAAYAIQGLKTLSQNNQFGISITELKDGFLYSVPYNNLGALLDYVAPQCGLIDNNWVYEAQQYEENEGRRFLNDFYTYALYTSVFSYLSAVIKNADMVSQMSMKAVQDVVNSVSHCLASYREIRDSAFVTFGNMTQQFSDMLSMDMSLTVESPKFKQAWGNWFAMAQKMYSYLMTNQNYTKGLQIFDDSYVWNIAFAGVTAQSTTYHRNIKYPLYNIGYESLGRALCSVNYSFSDITIIDMDAGDSAYSITTFAQQGKNIVKQCCAFADSGNGVMLRIMFSPKRVVVNG